MLHRDVFILEPIGLPGGVLDQAGEPLGNKHLTGRRTRTGYPRPAAQLSLHVLTQPVRIRPCAAKQWPDQALALVQQCQEQVLSIYLGVTEAERLGLRVMQCLLRLLSQTVQVHRSPPLAAW